MNVCREIPGVTDKSTFGHPGRYTFCIAENEEASPWEPYHVEHGMSLESSAVALIPACHPMEVFNQSDPVPEQILDTLSHAIAANSVCHGPVMLIMSPEHAQNIGPAGWSKQDVKEYLARRANEFQPHFGIRAGADRGFGRDVVSDHDQSGRLVDSDHCRWHYFDRGGGRGRGAFDYHSVVGSRGTKQERT